MKRYLLDTNVISELRKPKPHGAVTQWLSGLDDEQIFLSAVTLGELQTGIERTRGQDQKKANEIEMWVDQVAASFQVLPMDARCFRECARIAEGKSDHHIEDMMIAATSRIHDLVVATRNQKDFEDLGVPIINPFKSSG
jgi:predicted nucleic acid-binding protein